MDKRFLSRGKRTDDKGWVYGFYCTWFDENGGTVHTINRPAEGKNIATIIDPDTVCQCTGVTDKNGTYIYEKDIVTDPVGTLHIVTLWLGEWVITHGENWVRKYNLSRNYNYITVFGNTVDNPELWERI